MSAPLHVGLNLAFIAAESGGMSRYAHELVPALLRAEPRLRITAFVSAEAPDSLLRAPWAGELEWVSLPNRPTAAGAASVLSSLVAQWATLPVVAARRRMHLVHGLANVVPPLAPRLASVVTVPDVIWVRHTRSMGLRGTLGMRLASPVSVRRADRVITISRAAAHDVAAALHVPESKLDVIPLGVRAPAAGTPATGEPELRARFGLGDDRVVLCTAAIKRHKNLARLVEAHAMLPEPRPRLVLVGAPGGHEGDLLALARQHRSADRVHLTGFVSEADLEGLYGLAAAFVLPSLEEGFGLPVLEAMVRGIPVACSAASALPEVAADAALLFDPRDPGAITAALGRLLAEDALRGDLSARGRARAARFTWDATARATLETYERALAVRASTSR